MKRTPYVLALALVCFGWPAASPWAQNPATPTLPSTDCAGPMDITPAHLYGLWQLTLWPDGGSESQPVSSGAVLFERHPEYPGSVRGHLKRTAPGNDLQAQVSGDVVDGEFNLDESADGINMDAVWTGTPEACGRTIRGDRRPAEGRPGSEPTLNFRLQKAPGWG